MGLLGLCVSTILLRSHFAIREAVGLSGGVLNVRKQVTDCGLISFGLFSRFFLRTQTRLGKVPLLSSLFLYRGFFSRTWFLLFHQQNSASYFFCSFARCSLCRFLLLFLLFAVFFRRKKKPQMYNNHTDDDGMEGFPRSDDDDNVRFL